MKNLLDLDPAALTQWLYRIYVLDLRVFDTPTSFRVRNTNGGDRVIG